MDTAANVNLLTNLKFSNLPNDVHEIEALTSNIYNKIKLDKYLNEGFNVFALKYLSDLSSIKKHPNIIENFYNDKYFFFRSEIKSIEKDINEIIDKFITEHLKKYGNEKTLILINKIISGIELFNNNSQNIKSFKLDIKHSKYHELNKIYFDLTRNKMLYDINVLIVNRLSYLKENINQK